MRPYVPLGILGLSDWVTSKCRLRSYVASVNHTKARLKTTTGGRKPPYRANLFRILYFPDYISPMLYRTQKASILQILKNVRV